MSFSPEVESEARPGALEFGALEASNSRYAEPEAEGVTPVFRTIFVSILPTTSELNYLTHLP